MKKFDLEVGTWDNSQFTSVWVDLTKVTRIEIEVISGDEIANVFYKNGDYLRIDPDKKHTRISEFCKGSYTLYDLKRNIDRLADFMYRVEPYDMFKGQTVVKEDVSALIKA